MKLFRDCGLHQKSLFCYSLSRLESVCLYNMNIAAAQKLLCGLIFWTLRIVLLPVYTVCSAEGQ